MICRILLTGGSGQIGRDLCDLLPRLGSLTVPSRSQLDLCQPDQIRQVLRSVRPHIVVNAAAYTVVDKAESEQMAARRINGDAPMVLAEEAKSLQALLVHYSTDYVFDGLKRQPYVEDDLPNPQSVYGLTKLAGEQAIQQSGVAHLILRTAWIYSRQGRNFLCNILKQASEKEELRVVSDQFGSPTWSREVASATVQILAQVCAGGGTPNLDPAKAGIYHVTAGGEASWCDFAIAILAEASRCSHNLSWLPPGLHLPIRSRIVPVTTEEYPTAASRPTYSVLSNARLAKQFGIRLPDWKHQLHSVFNPSGGSLG